MATTKAITYKGEMFTRVLERQDWSIDFYDYETHKHHSRKVWYPVNGSDIYVQFGGRFYNIVTKRDDRYDPWACMAYDEITEAELEQSVIPLLDKYEGKTCDDCVFEETTRLYAYAIVNLGCDKNAGMFAVVNGMLNANPIW